MILSAHQPAYLPWLGYFDKIARADVFVFLDTVQFEKNSFINRNRIKTPQGMQWLTIPVKRKGHLASSLLETRIDTSRPWADKHLKAIRMNYRRAKYFDACAGRLEKLLSEPCVGLADLCWQQLRFWLDEFGIRTRVVRSSELGLLSSKSALVLELCRYFGADHYLSGALGRDYLVGDDFNASGIQLEFQSYVSPVYPQLWGGEFIPALSIVDYWLNCGPSPRLFTGPHA